MLIDQQAKDEEICQQKIALQKSSMCALLAGLN